MNPILGKVFQSALWSVATRWSDRAIGFLSTLILARLLTPADFGIIAMAMLLIGLVEVLLDLGVNIALIYDKEASKDDFDSAWTLRGLQTTGVAILVTLAAPFAAEYFHDTRVDIVLYGLAIGIAISGFENIGIVEYQKRLDFKSDFRFFVFKRVPSVLITIVAALALRNYWALVIGTVASRFIGVGVSYAIHPYRPRFCFRRVTKIWNISRWMIFRSVGGYLESRLDTFFVSSRSTSDVMGMYVTASELAALPTTELLAPLSRVLLPTFVEARGNSTKLKENYLLALGVQALIGIPSAVGMALVASEAVPLLLGDQWIQAVPFLQVLALYSGLSALGYSGAYLLTALGKVATLAIMGWIWSGLFILVNLVLYPSGDAIFLAYSRLFLGFVGIFVFSWLVIRQVDGLCWSDFFKVVIRPIIGATVLCLCVLQAKKIMPDALWLQLLFEVLLGVFSYGSTVFILWLLAGRPEGSERYLLKKLGFEKYF